MSGRFYYDQDEERIAIKEEVTFGEERDYYEDFAFYKQVSIMTKKYLLSHTPPPPPPTTHTHTCIHTHITLYTVNHKLVIDETHSVLGTDTMLGHNSATSMS